MNNFFRGTPKNPKSEVEPYESKETMNIPKMDIQRIQKHEVQRHTRRNRTVHKPHKRVSKKIKMLFAVTLLIFIFSLLFTGLFYISKWYDQHKIVFQNPIILVLKAPLYIANRLILSPVPKATYIEVSPLTTTKEIADAAKAGTVPQYADSGGITPISTDIVKTLVRNKVIQKFGADKWTEVEYIIHNESGFQPYIVNKSSGACGIFQVYPCSKLPSLDITDQINWGLNYYIPERYHTVDAAYKFKVANGTY